MACLLAACSAGCGDGGSASGGSAGNGGSGGNTTGGNGTGGTTSNPTGGNGTGGSPIPSSPSCETAGGSASVQAPVLKYQLADRWHEGWLASPAIADLDGDGKSEIVIAREEKLLCFGGDGALKWSFDFDGRSWASPIVADFTGDARLEIAFAARGQVFLLDADGKAIPPFPVAWDDEMRSLAAGDIDGDGSLDLVAAPAHGDVSDVMNAWQIGRAHV